MMEHPDEPLPAPTDIRSRTEYPRPWLGGTWKLRDIVDYELIATFALLESAADRRETLLQEIYEVNRVTIADGSQGTSWLRDRKLLPRSSRPTSMIRTRWWS